MHIKPRSVTLAVALLVGLAGLGIYLFRPVPVPVDLAEVRQDLMRQTVDVDGKTRIRDIYEVAAPMTGIALRSPVHVGDRVTAGETVVAVVEPVAPSLLDSRTRSQAEAAVREAEAATDLARARLTQAEVEVAYARTQLDRITALVDRGVASMTQLEDVTQQMRLREAELDTARSSLAMSEGALARARAALIEPDPAGMVVAGECCVRITAPADGVVLDIAQTSERPVAAGTILLSVGDPADLEIVADVLSSDAVRMSEGARAIVERWGGPGALEAVVRAIEPAARTRVSALGIEEQRVDVRLELTSPPEARAGLGEGYSVFLRIVEWEAENVLQVPLSALFRQGEDWVVFVVVDGVASLRPVVIGRRNGQVAEVLSGLASGDAVITHPGDKVADGVAVVDRRSLTDPGAGR
ncbi:HlyD family efflux transporter periplasmic adaptor subunit [Halovulum dunhuangense]|uniref:HlyD family efflux transporter periplasmic adaptor subunit n=1 Tax=Halovulum dunhuangense TaxID=1505036 RepID=A0A849L5P4_9RHOB|nr:HlyD family efflux transporter periplasmic adaptor subunit [Halovulum dunhuangense]NNU81686.1 HlyD family efflux transporter periplasmic adaptor subunit [Halovulum dunhuangense]